jgi:chromosome segregation protein
MRLKQLQIHGFKTFANPTNFNYQEGITAIVGPNGCGKSNIADAIRWALGEQAPSNLRTKKTEDLIFSGSATRPKMGMAQVTLTLENPFALDDERQLTDNQAPIQNHSSNGKADADDTTNSRRASIVEEILRARPTEVTITRRAYRSGENEYLINRQRVRLRDVHELLQRWGLARLTYAVIGQGLIDQALSLRAEERRALFEEAAGIGLYQNKKANALEKLEETQQNLLRVNDIINEIAPRLPALARQADRAGKSQAVSTALNEKLRAWYAFNWAHAQEGFLAAQAEEISARAKLDAQRVALHELGAQLTDARRAAQTLRAKLSDHHRAQQQRENEYAALERDYAVLQERARFAAAQETDAQRDSDAALTVEQNALSAWQAFQARPLTLSIAPAPASAQNTDSALALSPQTLAAQLAEYETSQRREIDALRQAAQQTDAEHAARVAKLDADAQRADEIWLAQTRALAQADEQNSHAQHTHAAQQLTQLEQERLAVEEQRARALAQQRLAQLRATEFETPQSSTLNSTADQDAPPDLAAHLIALQENLPLYESALAQIAGLAAQADDLARRARAARERERAQERVRLEMNAAHTALTLAERDAQQARHAAATAQRERERAAREHAQERERNRRERERERERTREQFAREREQLAREQTQRQREQEQLLRDRERLIQERARELERERVQLAREQERLAREEERERERIAREQQQAQERLAQECERAAQERLAKAARLATFSAQRAELRDQCAKQQTHVDAQRAVLDKFRAQAAPDENALAASEALQNELEEREAQLRRALTAVEELCNRAILDAERRRAEIARLEQEIEDDLGPVEMDSATPRQLRLRLVVRARSAENSNSLAGVAAGEEENQIENLANETLEQELITLPPVEALPDGFDKEIRRLKNQMRYIGNVNPNAPQEYAELKERHAFLVAQTADLTQALEGLYLAIQELDAMMKQKFQDTFNAINVEFKKYFSILFGGGTARLELTDPQDLIRSGIEITARPPGKRAAQLVLLSGGERALTAAALIFSILRVSPTPFCVMDEVDAALDEANVGRFRDSLAELADATQFIVITHNRVTMEGARAIYGVSMGEDGVSQVLSLKLEQAAANAR